MAQIMEANLFAPGVFLDSIQTGCKIVKRAESEKQKTAIVERLTEDLNRA